MCVCVVEGVSTPKKKRGKVSFIVPRMSCACTYSDKIKLLLQTNELVVLGIKQCKPVLGRLCHQQPSNAECEMDSARAGVQQHCFQLGTPSFCFCDLGDKGVFLDDLLACALFSAAIQTRIHREKGKRVL